MKMILCVCKLKKILYRCNKCDIIEETGKNAGL